MPDHPTLAGNRTVEVYATSSAVVFSDQARETWAAMDTHVRKLSRYYGESHPHTVTAALSLLRCHASLVGWGDVTVGRDGPLALICQARGITFGLIFHGQRRYCMNVIQECSDPAMHARSFRHDGCQRTCAAVINDDGATWTYMRDAEQCGREHTPSYPLDAPMPGDWSFHS